MCYSSKKVIIFTVMTTQPHNIWDKTIKVEQSSYYWHKTPVLHKGNIIAGKEPLVVELFCGCGGTSTGFEMAGYTIALGCDILTPAVATFKYNHPNATTILGDIKKVTPELLQKAIGTQQIDVLIGGVPCQGFSLNNRKRNKADERNFMYQEFLRFVQLLQPKAIVLENVSGMKSAGNFVEIIESELSKVGGMSVKSQLLYAPDYGVPQKRSRLFFIGIKGKSFDFDCITKTHGPNTAKNYVTIEEAIGDLPSLQNGEEKNQYSRAPFSTYQQLMRQHTTNNQLTNHKAPKHPSATIERIKTTTPGQPMYPRFKQRIRLAWDILSPTQVAGGIRPQFQLGHPSDNRGLSIRERCRIQSFPDHFEVLGGTVQARVQTGNAVPPLLAKAIGLAIKKEISNS